MFYFPPVQIIKPLNFYLPDLFKGSTLPTTAYSIPYFRKFVRVYSRVGRYFCNVYIVKMFAIVFSLNIKDNNI